VIVVEEKGSGKASGGDKGERDVFLGRDLLKGRGSCCCAVWKKVIAVRVPLNFIAKSFLLCRKTSTIRKINPHLSANK
jgi:hypothetical protein